MISSFTDNQMSEKCTVILPTFFPGEQIVKCIETVPKIFKIVIIDNSYDDRLIKFIKKYNFIVFLRFNIVIFVDNQIDSKILTIQNNQLYMPPADTRGESLSYTEVNQKEVELIKEHQSNNPSIGYNQWPRFKS